MGGGVGCGWVSEWGGGWRGGVEGGGVRGSGLWGCGRWGGVGWGLGGGPVMLEERGESLEPVP